jgi:hypothetical protein
MPNQEPDTRNLKKIKSKPIDKHKSTRRHTMGATK